MCKLRGGKEESSDTMNPGPKRTMTGETELPWYKLVYGEVSDEEKRRGGLWGVTTPMG